MCIRSFGIRLRGFGGIAFILHWRQKLDFIGGVVPSRKEDIILMGSVFGRAQVFINCLTIRFPLLSHCVETKQCMQKSRDELNKLPEWWLKRHI